MTEMVVTDCNLNTVCERVEQHCCVDDPSVIKRHGNTGARLWGRVRSKLLRQKVSLSLLVCFARLLVSRCVLVFVCVSDVH